jgi:hypothetical protein
MGGNEWLQLLASATAPMAASGVIAGAQAVGRAGREAVRPVTRAGAEQIAADTLGRLAEDKIKAASDLDYAIAAQQGGRMPPGYKPTAASGTNDYGVIGAEQMLSKQAQRAPDFARRNAQNNAALTDDLLRLRANNAQLEKWKALREEVTTPMRDEAFDNATGPVDFKPVADKVIRIAGTAEGGAEQSRRAIDWLVGKIKTYTDEGRIDPRNAYELEKDIGRLVAGKIETADGRLQLAGGLANEIRKELVAQINKVAPGFDRYLKTYSDMSKSIDRLETVKKTLGKGSDQLARVTNAGQVAGEFGAQDALSQAKVRNAIPAIEETLAKKRQQPLTDFQGRVLKRVDAALDDQTKASRGGKTPGSDTFQNLSTSNLFNSLLGDQMASAGVPQWITKPVGLFYGKTVEPRIQDTITRAFLDQQLMSDLLRKARTARRPITIKDLATSAEQNIYGGLLGGTLAQ